MNYVNWTDAAAAAAVALVVVVVVLLLWLKPALVVLVLLPLPLWLRQKLLREERSRRLAVTRKRKSFHIQHSLLLQVDYHTTAAALHSKRKMSPPKKYMHAIYCYHHFYHNSATAPRLLDRVCSGKLGHLMTYYQVATLPPMHFQTRMNDGWPWSSKLSISFRF